MGLRTAGRVAEPRLEGRVEALEATVRELTARLDRVAHHAAELDELRQAVADLKDEVEERREA